MVKAPLSAMFGFKDSNRFFLRSTRETDGTLDFTGVWLFEALGVQFWG
jgi:hypothetical protein